MENVTTPDFTWMFIKMLMGLGVVIGLAFVLLKYILPKTRLRSFQRHQWLQVVSRVPMTPKSSVYCVKFAERFFVLGVSEESVNLITELSPEEGKHIEKA